MFTPRSDALLLSEAGLQGLRLSLNTPVVRVEELADGPARAAIVLHAGEYGGLVLSVALRSLRDGRSAVYTWRGQSDPASLPTAWRAALDFGESLGFLFDEDELAHGTPEARERAFALWEAFGAVPERAAADDGFGDAALDLEPQELDLDMELELAPGDGPAPPPLSRFRPRPRMRRRVADPAEDTGGAGGSSALGRVPIVKRRAAADETPAAHPLLQLLASY